MKSFHQYVFEQDGISLEKQKSTDDAIKADRFFHRKYNQPPKPQKSLSRPDDSGISLDYRPNDQDNSIGGAIKWARLSGRFNKQPK
jgi:hypothetical protein